MIDCNPLFLELEVLTLLPLRDVGGYALLRDLVEDLGQAGQPAIRQAIDILRQKHGIRVDRTHRNLRWEAFLPLCQFVGLQKLLILR